MAFADHLTTPKPRAGARPVVETHLTAMGDEEAADAVTLLRSSASDDVVARAFTAEGFPASNTAVRTWRIANRVGRFA